jgi:hypothetical protein
MRAPEYINVERVSEISKHALCLRWMDAITALVCVYTFSYTRSGLFCVVSVCESAAGRL